MSSNPTVTGTSIGSGFRHKGRLYVHGDEITLDHKTANSLFAMGRFKPNNPEDLIQPVADAIAAAIPESVEAMDKFNRGEAGPE